VDKYDSDLNIKTLSSIPVGLNLNYKAFFDPVFYRLILDFDVPLNKLSH
jgi:hypothetical protein